MKNSKGKAEDKVISVKIEGKTILVAIAIAAIILGGAALRVHTLADTPYPYVLDGLTESRYAEHIAYTGSLVPEVGSSYNTTHTTTTSAFDIFLAENSLFEGEPALFLIQKLIAPFTVFMLLGVFVLARKLSGNVRASLIALMGAATFGSFVLATQGSWKECIGISFLPVLFVTFMMRKEPGMRVVSTVLLFSLPFVHHLVALVALLSLSVYAAIRIAMLRKERGLDSTSIVDVLIIVAASCAMSFYYILEKFDRLDYLSPDNGLYLFFGLAVMITIGAYYLSSRLLTHSGKLALAAVNSALVVLVIAMNLISPVGMIDTNAYWAISLPLIAAVAVAVAGICGISLWTGTTGDSKVLFIAMLSGPSIVMAYGLLRAGDLLSFDIVTRTTDLFDIGILIGFGALMAYVLKDRSWKRCAFIAIALCAALLLTLPIAIDSEKFVGTRNDIYTYEVDAIEWAINRSASATIDTDTHYANVGVLFDKAMDEKLVRRFEGTIPFRSGITMIANQRWVDIGVKDIPYGWVKVDGDMFNSELDRSNVVYLGGPQGSQIFIFYN